MKPTITEDEYADLCQKADLPALSPLADSTLPRIDDQTDTVHLSDGSSWTGLAIAELPELFIRAAMRPVLRSNMEGSRADEN